MKQYERQKEYWKMNSPVCSKFSKPGFSNTWTVNFQMCKPVLEKAEEPEIKLPTSLPDHQKSKRVPEKHLFLLYWLSQSLRLCGSQCKILKELGILDHLTCLVRNLHAGQEATVRTGHGITDWFQIGKGICQGCILSPYLFNLYAEYIMRNSAELMSTESVMPSNRLILCCPLLLLPLIFPSSRVF